MAGYIGSKSSVTQVDGYSEAEADAEFVNDPNGAITVSGDNVGIGTSLPLDALHIASAVSTDYRGNVFLQDTTSMAAGVGGQLTFGGNYTSSGVATEWSAIQGTKSNSSDDYSGQIEFKTRKQGYALETKMTIDSSGNLLVGKTGGGLATSGHTLFPNGQIDSSVDGAYVAKFNRKSSDGTIIELRKDTTNIVGSIGSQGGSLTIGTGETGLKFADVSDSIVPWNSSSNIFRDNAVDVGHANVRFDDIYATNGTIQTSDFNEKQDIASLTATEMLVGKRISALFKTFRWKDSVAEKGDNARTHTGVIAQDVQAAFTAEGLDAGDYALFISSTWWEHDVDVPAVEAVEAVDAVTETTTDEDGNEVVTVITEAVEAVEAKDAYTRTDTYDTEDEAPEGATSKTRMGIRYPELLSFVAAYNEQRFASIEARLTALEA